MKTITIEELLQLDQNTITVLDVRPADAYTRGSVPGAVSIPLAEVEERMEELPKEKPVYVLCHTGEWSVDAVYELEAAGYDAANIEGGYRSFLRKKLSSCRMKILPERSRKRLNAVSSRNSARESGESSRKESENTI